jgi:hypothetical protein
MIGLTLVKDQIYTDSVYDDICANVKKAYNEYKKNIIDQDYERVNGFGIRYKTVHDMSYHCDTHDILFSSEPLRDSVFKDWEERRYWDKIFECELLYPYPKENAHDFEKIFVSSDGVVYTSK